MAGETAATAELQAIDNVAVEHTITGSPDGEVWVRFEPSVSMFIKITMVGLAGFEPYADVYRVSGTDPPAGSGDLTSVGWVWAEDHPYTIFEVQGGEAYVLACYDAETFSPGTGDFEITLQNFPGGPANDSILNAQIITAGSPQTLAGTTVDASLEELEFQDTLGDDQTPSVWFKLTTLGPGVLTYGIRSLTPGWNPRVWVMHAAGAVSDWSDVDLDNVGPHVGNGTEEPPTVIYDQIGTPGSTAGDLSPITGGEVFYFRVSGYDDLGASEVGAFELYVNSASAPTCLDAEDYINGDSPTATVVSGSVRETQVMDLFTNNPYESWFADMPDTLTIPGSAITDSPGFFAATVKTKNCSAPGSGFSLGFRRNGLPMLPSMYLTSTAGATAFEEPVTGRAGVTSDSDDPQFLDTITALWRLPVHPDDEIGVVVGYMDPYGSGEQIDIEQICFQNVGAAQVGQLVDTLDMPNMPLGFPTLPTRGLFEPPTAAEPSNTNTVLFGVDMCVTDDGNIWVLFVQAKTTGGFTYTGPVLKMWDGATWTTIDNDIAGYGIRRTFIGGTSGHYGPVCVSMDTDGEDLWIAYGVDDLNPNTANPPYYNIGNTRNGAIRVKKYDVSADTFSDVGPLLFANTTRRDIHAEAGGPDGGIHLKLSPAGAIWVGFIDFDDRDFDKFHGNMVRGQDRHAYAAKYDSVNNEWDVYHLGLPTLLNLDHPDDLDVEGTLLYQAEDEIAGGGTATTDTRFGEACVKEVQTAYTADTIKFIPPAGNWAFTMPYVWDKTAGTGGIGWKLYKDGVEYGYEFVASSSGSNPTVWGVPPSPQFWMEFDGTEELEIRVKKTGTSVAVYIDEVHMYPHWVVAQRAGGRGFQDVAWVEASQYHVNLVFNNSDEPESPRAVYAYISNYPDSVTVATFPGGGHANNSKAYHKFKYAEFIQANNEFSDIWDVMIEEETPDFVTYLTKNNPSIIWGHNQEGLGAYLDPETGKAYMVACLMAHSSLGDTVYVAELTDSGPVPPAETIRSPGVISPFGGFIANNSLRTFASPSYYWDCHANAMVIDARGNMWVAWWGQGAWGGEMHIAQLVDTGTGGWVTASKINLPMGQPQQDHPGPVLRMNPAGDTLYLAGSMFIWDDATYSTWHTFGVWEIPIIEDDWESLTEIRGGMIDLSRLRFRAFEMGEEATG